MVTRNWLLITALAGLLACGGSKSESTVSGTDPDSLQNSPGGAAALALVDIESVRPDDVNLAPMIMQGAQSAAAVVGCRTFNTVSDNTTRTTTVTYTNCTGSNGWTLNGTVVFSCPIAQPGSYSAAYDLHSQDDTGTKNWSYTGTKLVTIDTASSTATVSVPSGSFMTVVCQNTQDNTKNRTYHYVPNLTADWATIGQFKLYGSYGFERVGGVALTATVASATPLIWTPLCCSPSSGTILLTSGNSSLTAIFGPSCGNLSLNGAELLVGCH